MKTVIVGCGRVGAAIAEQFDQLGHEVIILDTQTRSFDRLPSNFGGSAIRGDGTDEDTLRRAGAEDADVFLALTEGDNRNVMAAQIAVEELSARRVIAKINDPLRAAAYAQMGLATLCRTVLQADAVASYLGIPTSGLATVLPPTGVHPGGEHHRGDTGPVATPGGTATGSTPGVTEAVASGSAGPVAPTESASRPAGPAESREG